MTGALWNRLSDPQTGIPGSFRRRGRSANRFGFVLGNHVQLLQNGTAYFPAIETAIDRASQEIYFETYIYQNDTTGRRIADALQRAARRGVKVQAVIQSMMIIQ